jgi:hypothetical protein
MAKLATDMTHAEAMARSPIKPGAQYRFDYPYEFTSLDDYSAHRGAIVQVLRPCSADEADILWDTPNGDDEEIVDRMFKVRADDGWEGDAWESELQPVDSAKPEPNDWGLLMPNEQKAGG